MFRFMIRDVMWLTVVVAMGLALWQSERRSMDQAGKLLYLRGNWEDVKAAGKEYLGIHLKGNAEQERVAIEVVVQPTKR